jgi:predicted nucleotidyltransferase
MKTYTVRELADKLRPVFASAPVYRAVLFGSYARGTATARSDVDVIIDRRGELRGLNFYGVLDDMVRALDKPVDLFEAAEIRPDSPIRDEIARRGIVLYER